MKKAAIYVRVSTQEQKKHGLSVDSQIQALNDYCGSHELKIVGIYNDAGISARKRYTKRPALLSLLDDCRSGKIDLILFTKLDRWFRSVADYYEVQKVLDDNGVKWRAIWEDYETETSAGVFKVNIMLSVAQSEADRTSERIKAVNEYKKAQGHYVGSAPTGYKVIGKDLVKDDKTRDGMQAAFDEYLRSFSSKRALDAAADHGLFLEKQSFLLMLHRSAYYGDASGYRCDPYITKDQWDLIQENLKRRSRSTKNKRVYLFTGLVKCGYCGHIMCGHAVIRKYRENCEYKKYTCDASQGSKRKCPHLQISEIFLEEYMINQIENAIDAHNLTIDRVNSSDDVSSAIKKKTALEAKLKRVALMYEDGDLTIEEYRSKRDSIKCEIAKIVIEPAKKKDPLPVEWKEIYSLLDDQHKQTFWRKIIKNIEVTNETKSSPKITLL